MRTYPSPSVRCSCTLPQAGSTNNATHDGPNVNCQCTGGANVWYRFTTPAEGTVYLDTAGANFDASLFLTNNSGTLVAGQADSSLPAAGLCNDDSGCGTGGGFTNGNQARTAGVLPAGIYNVAVGGCGTGTFTLRLQFIATSAARVFFRPRIDGTGNTGVLGFGGGASANAGTCGGTGGAEQARWFLSCGAIAERQLFSTCRSDSGAFFTERFSIGSSTRFDPVIYVRSAQTGNQVDCNDDGPSSSDCRGIVPNSLGSFIGGLGSSEFGARVGAIQTPRGLGVVFLDTRNSASGMFYNMHFETR